jgi:hypothetical protein
MIGMNLIVVKNNTIFTLYLDSEECGSERLASYGELHGDDISSLHRVAPPPMPLSISLVFTNPFSSRPSFLDTAYDIR